VSGKKPLLYLDACCYNRPFDASTEERVAREAEAVLCILKGVVMGEFELLSSEALSQELGRIKESEKRQRCLSMAASATRHSTIDAAVTEEARAFALLGMGRLDALHLSLALKSRADVLLTTDDRFLRRARAACEHRSILVANPLAWLENRKDRADS